MTDCGGAVLQAVGVTLGYGGRDIVKGLDLAIPAGRFTVLIGPNGSGKSTVLRGLAGQLAPREGVVLLDGQPLARLSAGKRARRLGFLPQGPLAPEGVTVEGLVRLGRHPHRGMFGLWTAQDTAICRNAMSRTGVAAQAALPLDTLSGGQRQRAWIAMTLAQETGILLLDEPTTYLDLAHQIEVLDLVRILVDEGSVGVVVLHDLQLAARYADQLVLLREGQLIARGAPVEVMTEARIGEVFNLPVRIIPDPESGRPLCLPRMR